ncbi:microtubule associated protein-domain-containing protein [Pholiota molesta]|nr:microtubule associated protein-domain-containing protein [Pholiota molesta]
MSLPTSATTMLTTLLNSLHSHLQSQTQFLPTLHAQLGLPPSALEDELRDLQQQLVEGVESQVNKRRQEVEEWANKCEDALGGNVKATGSSLAELRKENALPRRYEMISEYQEKLRQLYHTKLEQLHTLSNRIQDVIDPVPAPGHASPGANRDVTPERFMKLEKELVRGKAEVHKRLNQLSGIFVQIDWLYTELGISPPAHDESPPSPVFGASSTLALAQSTASSSSNDPFLASTPTPACRSSASMLLFREDVSMAPEYEYQQIFAKFVLRVEEVDSGSTQPASQNVPPTNSLLTWAANLQASLEETKRLWRRLGVADAEMDMFVEAHRGSTQEAVQEYEEELERMLELKRERMGTFVESAREEIVKLWDDLMVGEDERADLRHLRTVSLTIHEDEVKRLKDERRKYFDICGEEKELAASAADQSRLTGRGSRDPGRLLREEKMRKRVSKEKPRLEQDLSISIPAWEEDAGRPFLVHGARFMDILNEALDAADQEKENKRRPAGRAGSVPARATTPTGHAGYMPGVRTGVVTPAVRSSASLGRVVTVYPTSVSALARTERHAYGRAASAGYRAPSAGATYGTQKAAAVVKATRARRESFKPRPSIDAVDHAGHGTGGFTVKEEDEC